MKLDGPPITPAGMAALRARYDHLLGTERPAITEVVSWAAGNGDRSENGDYLYGRKRIDPGAQADKTRAWFGATVNIADDDDNQRTVTLVGDDEQDVESGRIGWSAPLARALRGAAVGDVRTVHLPGGEKTWEVLGISSPGF